MRPAGLALAVLVGAPASAITPLDRIGAIAAEAGEVIGAAAGCGVPQSRTNAVRRAVFRLYGSTLLRRSAFRDLASAEWCLIGTTAMIGSLQPPTCASSGSAFEFMVMATSASPGLGVEEFADV